MNCYRVNFTSLSHRDRKPLFVAAEGVEDAEFIAHTNKIDISSVIESIDLIAEDLIIASHNLF